jgi:hypothetical protein
MIQFPRSLARQVRAVFRKLAPRGTAPKVSLTAGLGGLFVRLHGTEILAECRVPGDLPPEVLAVPLDAFAGFEGRGGDLVTLETVEEGVRTRWCDRGVPQCVDHEAIATAEIREYPPLPEPLSIIDTTILAALADASRSASHDSIRFALNHVQLRGAVGTVVATDGRQLLVQSGFTFPWTEEILIPASPVFACKELAGHATVMIGKSDTHVAIQIGIWTFLLPIDKQGRFPRVEDVMPNPNRVKARAHLDRQDAVYLTRALPRLPGGDDDHAPVTLHLNGQVHVRARAEGQSHTTELTLAQSQVSGDPVGCAFNRGFLARALQLGLGDIQIVDADSPMVFEDEKRKFVVMALGKDAVLKPRDDAIRLSTAEAALTNPRPQQPRSTPVASESPSNVSVSNGAANGSAPEMGPSNGTHETVAAAPAKGRRRKLKSTGIAALIEEAEALKSDLRAAFTRSHALVVALKRHKKQSQGVQSALRSLKDLQSVEA